jgi:MFS transporter, CP family, cyanate transporter
VFSLTPRARSRVAVRAAVASRGGHQPSPLLLLAAVVLVAVKLRAPISGFGAVLAEVRAATGLSAAAAGLVTSMPMLCFAVVGALSPWLSRRFGLDRAIGWSVVVLVAALLLRVTGGVPMLLLGTLLVCSGIAVVNVLLPVVVKQRFPHRIGPVTGAYTAALAGGSAFAAGVSAPLAEVVGWRTALGCWALLGAAAVVLWAVAVRASPGPAPLISPDDVLLDDVLPDDVAASAARAPWWTSLHYLLTHPLSWAVAVFFGAQSCLAYIQMGWLPAIYRDAGFDARTAGAMLAVSIVVGVPISLIVPSLAARRPDQRAWAVGLTLSSAVGLLGLILAPVGGAWVWALLIGVGTGAFPLALTMFSLRTETAADTGALSAFGQGVGYLLGAAGPLGFGLLHDSSGAWTVPLLALLAVTGVQVLAALVAGRDVVLSPRR